MPPPASSPNASSRLARITPGLASLLQYRFNWLPRDLAAGVSVAAVALPVGIAYADLAGVPAVIGMYAAIFPLFAYALFGSSRQLMTGPDAATCIMVAASLGPLAAGDPQRYQALVVALTLCTGLIYLLSGFIKMGFIANFLSVPILAGFLNGVALLIIVGQIKKLLGYSGEASGFFPQLAEFADKIPQADIATAGLGLGLLFTLLLLRRLTPKLPNPLFIVLLGILLVGVFKLEQAGVKVLGHVPAGLPAAPSLPDVPLSLYDTLFRDAVALMLVSFTSGILTAKSFAQRNHYEINPNQELIGFGAANLASGLAQGFPVTGADSRTAVNNAMGGKSQMVGIIAGGTMLLVLFFLSEPLAQIPIAALAAVIIVAAAGLFDIATLRQLYGISRSELLFSLGTTLGVLLLGVLPGVMLAVVLSLLSLLAISSKPRDAVLGQLEGESGFHSCRDYPDAKTLPGLLIYRFESDVVFFNASYFKERLLATIAASEHAVEWVVLDASPINVVDVTALKLFDELRGELAKKGVTLAVAREKRSVRRFFQEEWVNARRELNQQHSFPTLRAAVSAFERREKAAGTSD